MDSFNNDFLKKGGKGYDPYAALIYKSLTNKHTAINTVNFSQKSFSKIEEGKLNTND